ncbi:isoaspartyl peptidase/L-asparaginase [Haloglomus litoreum]|uniref:isoaspartyl peptidase/L-asparaginase n=1 Tax=Haloglomus litoreum TaxID=3034026 RepID=UPI0023E80547|nr:isoaspartyl peptidase/L-asparaginase [Haloglomus sp. DT116]
MQVIVHGGAGSPADEPDDRQRVLDEAAVSGSEAATPTEAVVAAVTVLERDERFNAGVGSAVQSDGIPRTDAGLMTDDREVGAACAMPGVRDAAEVARVVAEETPHVQVAGVHAVDLADDFGVETGVDLWTDATRERWAGMDEAAPPATGPAQDHLAWVDRQFGRDDAGTAVPDASEAGSDRDDARDHADGRDHDTVGAVARDHDRFAAATSTGGRWAALAGRVGDVPQVGCGFYCSRAGGASATGAGEDIARVTMARRAVAHLEMGRDAADAADLAVEELADYTGAEAGIIVLDNRGGVGEAYNSDAMQTAVARADSGDGG